MAISGLWSRLQGGIVGGGVAIAAGDVLRPVFERLRQEAWKDHPDRVLSPATLAQLVALGITEFGTAAEHASREGYNVNSFRALVEEALSPPPLGSALDAFRRGLITEAQYRHALTKSGIETQYHGPLVGLRNLLASPSELVLMAVREVFDPQQRSALQLDAEYPGALTAEGGLLGYSEATMRNIWAAHWQLPSYTQGVEMFFRQVISSQQLDRLLKALDYAPTWRGPLLEIARRIPTVPDFTRMAYREVFDPQQRSSLGLDAEYPSAFTAKVALHGMSEADARDLWAAHWRLPSAMQGYRMLFRGEITQAELFGLLKALDYPPRWRAPLMNIARIVPGRIDLKRLLRHGIISEAQTQAGYERLGYSPADAANMTAIAVAELAAGDVTQTWANRARGRLFTVAHNEYLASSIDAAEAGQMLALIGAPAPERTLVMQLWNAERSINRLELTPAQIKRAYREGPPEGYDETTAVSELVERGMTSEDALRFLRT